MDRYFQIKYRPLKAYFTLISFFRTTKLAYIWRLYHPTDNKFTFFSNPHNSYFLIDFLSTAHHLIPSITDPTFKNIDTWWPA